LQASDQAASNVSGLTMNIFLNIAIFVAFMTVYEVCRRIQWASPIYFKRTQKRILRVRL
jgi:hypothetical protein